MLVGNTKQIPLDTARYVVNIPPFIAPFATSLPFSPLHPSWNCPSFQTAQTRLPSLHILYLIAPAPARRLGARASAPIPPLSPPQHPSPAQTHQAPASGCSPSACDCPASYLPCTSAVPRHTSRKFFCLFKNPVLLTQLPPPLSVSRASISSDLYSINTSIGHSPADSPIHLARQLDLFPLTALVFVRLFGTDLFPSLAQPSSLLLFSKTTSNLVSFSHPRYAFKVRRNPLHFHHRIGALSSSVGARSLQPVHEVDRSPTNLRNTSTFDL